jgi:hypothetical protein
MTWALSCSLAFTVSAQSYYVATNGNDSASGTSWDTALLTISNAIVKASAGQTVAVSNGTYVLSTQLLLNKGITLQGVGGAANTIIDANLTGRILSMSDSAAVMDGFTLKNGLSATAINGVGVNMTGGTLQNCTVSACTNTASGTIRGGGIFMSGSSCLVTNCLISGNYIGLDGATSSGGGIFNSGGRILSSTVTNNTVQQGRAAGGGGGIYVIDGGIISNCTIVANFADCTDVATTGGGICVDGGTVVDCLISNNKTASKTGPTYGGGVAMKGNSRVERCIISGNTQVGYSPWYPLLRGAGISLEGIGCLATNCVIVNNYSGADYHQPQGCGAYVSGGVLVSSQIQSNTANGGRETGKGGGVFITSAGVVNRCTIANNKLNVVDSATRGGGVYVDWGTLSDCVISNNYSTAGFSVAAHACGGGVYMTGRALVERCTISRNFQNSNSANLRYGAGVYSDGGIMRSCLIMGNTANTVGGGLYITAGTNENCTIVRNLCSGGNYGGVYWTNTPVIVNAIVYNNTGAIENNILPVVGSVSGVTYSCAPSLTSGTGNVMADPLFVDSGIGNGTTFTPGDYRPVLGSPCEKTGLVAGWMSTALELAGLPRLSSGQVEIGAYAAVPPKSTFVAESGDDSNDGTSWGTAFKTIQKGIDAATALGTVSVNNGTYVLTTQLLLGKGCKVIGIGGKSSTIINANATGRIITIDHANAVVEGFSLLYGNTATVSFNGTGVNMAGGTLRNCLISGCTNTASSAQGVGVYMTGGTVDTCVIEKNRGSGAGVLGGGIFISGASCLVTNCIITGNQVATSDGGSKKGGGAYIAAGRLLGSTISSNLLNQGRDSTGGGGGVFVTGSGTVSNCMIAANTLTCVDTKTYGGGVCIDGGAVTDCVVSNNSGAGYSPGNPNYGGGVYMRGMSLVERCVITRNYQTLGNWQSARYGAGVACDGGTMRSCLIMGNRANSQGGGLYITGGTNENCTIVRNQCLYDSSFCGLGQYGGVYWTNAPVIINAIVYNNTSSYEENNIQPIVDGLSQVTYSCSPSLTSGTGNITADPLFTASGTGSGTTFTPGDYRLVAGTPCRNKGQTEQRMKATTDLDRLPRVKDFVVDMGAYERQTTSGSMIKFF